MPYEVTTPVFEGPFDLLLHLILKEEVDRPLDHKNLNLDVPDLKGRVPTAENLARMLALYCGRGEAGSKDLAEVRRSVSPRIAKILAGCKVTTDGDDIIIKGTSLELIGQTSANIEQATKIKRKDQRIFLDGIYVYEKKRN